MITFTGSICNSDIHAQSIIYHRLAITVCGKLVISVGMYSISNNNNNNNNKHDNVYGAVIMAKPLREFIRFI